MKDIHRMSLTKNQLALIRGGDPYTIDSVASILWCDKNWVTKEALYPALKEHFPKHEYERYINHPARKFDWDPR